MRRNDETVGTASSAASLARLLARKSSAIASRRFSRSKSNVTVDEGGFDYEIEPVQLPFGTSTIETTRIRWKGERKGSARKILSEIEHMELKEDAPNKLEEAKKELLHYLSAGPQPMLRVMEDVRSLTGCWNCHNTQLAAVALSRR